MSSNKVFARGPTPTTKSYLDAVADIIRRTQGNLTDGEYADRIGTCEGTVRNARNKKAKLSGDTLARIGFEFGPGSLDPFMATFDAIGVPRNGIGANDLQTIAGMSHVAGDWIDRLRDGRRCHQDTIALAEALRPLLTALTAIVEEAEQHQRNAA